MSNQELDRCREKQRLYGKRSYAKNGKKKLAATKERRKKDPLFAQMLRDSTRRSKAKQYDKLNLLKGVPCLDCKECFHPVCMDFDHRDPSTKVQDIARMIGAPWEKTLAEIAKCDLICANCHRIRTKRRRHGVTRKPLFAQQLSDATVSSTDKARR
jgi:hypothetical protein